MNKKQGFYSFLEGYSWKMKIKKIDSFFDLIDY